jgi:hypothetical protein
MGQKEGGKVEGELEERRSWTWKGIRRGVGIGLGTVGFGCRPS